MVIYGAVVTFQMSWTLIKQFITQSCGRKSYGGRLGYGRELHTVGVL